ncbi:PH domain-containing protein [Arenimonas terrae]|uniref:PH domain-containing protein n=1 Tax=Arenimonas terrae TaxID=2546226 RepID=A0A5C4RR56_9GAMM|nr:PH domain-containing protein [Arenimonas terrae]TNJ33027.1 PH domain-containing protein [Arenimonas terrae]
MTEAQPPHEPVAPADWQSLPEAARRVFSIVGGLSALPVGLGLVIPTFALVPGWPARIAVALLVVAAVVAAGAALGRLRWGRTGWRLDSRGLQVRRGLVWRSEVLVPRSRVQHLDLERGPIERRHGLATLVVHTAGTRLYALRQSGFVDADAVALRDALLPEAARHDDAV